MEVVVSVAALCGALSGLVTTAIGYTAGYLAARSKYRGDSTKS